MADYYRDVVRYLRDNDYEFKRQGRGGHEIWWNPRSGHRVTVDSEIEIEDHGERDSEGRRLAKGVLSASQVRPDLAAKAPPPGPT
jgi:hypothetical protein